LESPCNVDIGKSGKGARDSRRVTSRHRGCPPGRSDRPRLRWRQGTECRDGADLHQSVIRPPLQRGSLRAMSRGPVRRKIRQHIAVDSGYAGRRTV